MGCGAIAPQKGFGDFVPEPCPLPLWGEGEGWGQIWDIIPRKNFFDKLRYPFGMPFSVIYTGARNHTTFRKI